MTVSFALRRPRMTDSECLLAGRNSPRVHPYLFGDHRITPEEHRRWYEPRLTDTDMPIFLLLQGDVPLGLVNLTHFNKEHNRGEWSFYIWEEAAPKGSGTAMLVGFLDELFLRKGLRKMVALVLQSNTRSLHLHRKLGFSEEGLLRQHVIKGGVGQDVVSFGLLAEEWQKRREVFAAVREQVLFA